MGAAAGREMPKVVGWIERAAGTMANFRSSIEGVVAQIPRLGVAFGGRELFGFSFGDAVARAAKLRDLGDTVAAGETGPGAVTAAELGRLSTPTPPLIKPPDLKALESATAALAAFHAKLTELQAELQSGGDETQKKLAAITAEVAKAAVQFRTFRISLASSGASVPDGADHHRSATGRLRQADGWPWPEPSKPPISWKPKSKSRSTTPPAHSRSRRTP
jgi:hypothetical protein